MRGDGAYLQTGQPPATRTLEAKRCRGRCTDTGEKETVYRRTLGKCTAVPRISTGGDNVLSKYSPSLARSRVATTHAPSAARDFSKTVATHAARRSGSGSWASAFAFAFAFAFASSVGGRTRNLSPFKGHTERVA